MQILRKYQLDIVFLFFAEILILSCFLLLIKYFDADPHRYEWFLASPLIILYTVALLQMRDKINLSERRRLTGKTLVYWIILGINLFLTYSTPVAAANYLSLDLFFVIFTIFLADSYWDFKTLKIKDIFGKNK